MVTKKFRIIIPILFLIVAMLACESSGQVSVDEEIDPAITSTVEVVEPTPTKPIYTPTAKYTSTPSPIGYATITAYQCNLRSGPSTNYSITGSGVKDEVLPVYGKNLDGTWLWVDWTQPLWIASSLVDLDIDISEITIVMDDVATVSVDDKRTDVVPVISPTEALTKTPTATPIPDSAGYSDWMVYKDQYVGVKDIAWDTRFGYFRPEQGEIFLSLYVIALNNSGSTQTFREGDFGIVDGQGKLSGHTIFSSKEPSFGTCTVRPGGICEGWWSTMILNRPDVKDNIIFLWDPCWFCTRLEAPISTR